MRLPMEVVMMKKLSYILGAIGTLLFVYACIGRFVYEPTVFGRFHAMQAKTVVMGANTILLFAILAALCAHDQKTDKK
jgi:multisubunit Na+/H+ antiporter MnhG subunit